MSEKSTILILHHNDADGICSAAIVADAISNRFNIIFKEQNYGAETWCSEDLAEAYRVYMLDFTSDDMINFVNACKDKLVWIDHHKTAMEKYPGLWHDIDIKGIRSIEKAACRLTWEYTYNPYFIPDAVRYIADRDIWKFELKDTKAFCEGFNTIVKTPDDPQWNGLLQIDEVPVNHMIYIGNILLDAKRYRVEKAFDRGIDFTFWNHSARLVNATGDISEIGEYIYTKPEYDIAVMWQAINDKVIFSLRSNSKDPDAPDVSYIAKIYGGGGHKNAAGFEIKDMDFPLLLLGVTE